MLDSSFVLSFVRPAFNCHYYSKDTLDCFLQERQECSCRRTFCRCRGGEGGERADTQVGQIFADKEMDNMERHLGISTKVKRSSWTCLRMSTGR